MTRFRAVILDVDGTLVDSNDAHAKAWVEALAAYGYTVPFEKVRPLIGKGGDTLIYSSLISATFLWLMPCNKCTFLQQKFVVEVIMSVRQANKPNTETDTQEHKVSLMSEFPSPSQHSQARKPSTYWQIPYYWLITHTFEPQWLPKSLRHPLIGYLVAILLASITTFLTLQFVQIYPSFAFAGLLEVLAVALVALIWGVGPSLLATLIGAILLNFFILPPPFSWSLHDTTSLVETALFLLVGFTISIVASQIERAR